MAIRVPGDATIFNDKHPRLNYIRLLGTLRDRLVDGEEGFSASAKEAMRKAKADYAQTDLVIASLRPGPSLGDVPAADLYELVGRAPKKGPTLTIDQFLQCVAVRINPLEDFLAGEVIDSLREPIKDPQPRLVTEWKPGIELDVIVAAAALGDVLKKATRNKAA